MRQVSQTTQFSRDVKRMRKRGKALDKLRAVVRRFAAGKALHAKHRDRALVERWQPSRDCHVEPDWILIYTIDEAALRLERTGTHSALFKQ